MTSPPRLFLLAGEASGDRIGAALIAALRRRADVEVMGVGGEAMAEQGLSTLFPMEDLAVMGYGDVLSRLPLLLWRARQTVKAILDARPEAVVLIDAQVFSQVVAGRLRRKGFRRPILLYVAPAVWAWKPERAPKLAPLFDEVLSVLPFEPEAMDRLGGPPTRYVGHPATRRFPMRSAAPDKGPVLLLPGSRRGELRRHLPLMEAVATTLADDPAVTGFAIPTPAGLRRSVAEATASWPMRVEIVSEEAERLRLMEEAMLALAVSGTATLELALAGVPHVITYVAEAAQVRLYRRATTRRIGLPNILLGRDLVPEVLFAGRADAAVALAPMRTLLADPAARERQVAGFIEIRTLLENGAPDAPRADAAERVLSYLS